MQVCNLQAQLQCCVCVYVHVIVLCVIKYRNAVSCMNWWLSQLSGIKLVLNARCSCDWEAAHVGILSAICIDSLLTRVAVLVSVKNT